MKHFFRLILRVEPGGSRRHDEWIAGTLAELSAILVEDLVSPVGAYHAILHGQEMTLECWQGPSLVARLGIGPALSIDIEGQEDPVTFDEEGGALGPDLEEDERERL